MRNIIQKYFILIALPSFGHANNSVILQGIGNLRVDKINVRYSVSYENKLFDVLEENNQELLIHQEKLDQANSRRKSPSKAMQKIQLRVKDLLERKTFIEDEMKNIPIEVKKGVESSLAKVLMGERSVILNIQIGSFSAPSHLQTIWSFIADSIAANIIVIDAETEKIITTFMVSDVDSAIYVGGATGAFIRAIDDRSDMIEGFSEKLVAVLFPS
jgi:hypothetical protein